jgi:regulator of protease activity HflC (stomatin/prohibitin superfamily)
MREQFIEVPKQQVITKDNASVEVDGVVFYTVVNAAEASFNVANLEKSLETLKLTNLRAVIGSMDLDEVLSHRDQINERLMEVIGQAADPWGVKINRVELRDINPPRDMQKVMMEQMTAEREKRASILRAEGDKQSTILIAEGKRQAAFLAAEARERSAQAEAKATNLVSDAIGSGDTMAINYFIAQEYMKALGELAREKE